MTTKKKKHKVSKQSLIVRIDTPTLQQKLGAEVLANFTMLLSALNKINTLWDLMHLTDLATKDIDSARSERNRSSAIILTIGVLHELHGLLQTFCQHVKRDGITHNKIIEILSVYDENNELRRLLTEYRNHISFHLSQEIVDILTADQVNITKGVDIFVKYGLQIMRDTYYFAADETIHRAFFKNANADLFAECESLYDEFDDIYKDRVARFFDYVLEVHTKVTNEGVNLVVAIMDEFGLERGDFQLSEETT